MSGSVTVAPSTRRPRQCHPPAAPFATIPLASRASVEIIVAGRCERAWQWPHVSVLPGFRPPITRLTLASLTTCRQLPSADSTWATNIDKVSVGGNTRSR